MNKIVKILVEILLALAAVGCVYGIYRSIMKPVNFNKEKARRQEVAVQRLKDIRTLEVAFKGVNNRYTASIDSLIDFYNNGKMDIIMQVGSNDDSLAVENTNKYKNDKAFKKLSKEEQNAKFMELYRKGEKLVFSISTPIAVKDTLFNSRPDFCADSLKYIPFSGKMPVETDDRRDREDRLRCPGAAVRGPHALEGPPQGHGQPASHQPRCRMRGPEPLHRPAGRLCQPAEQQRR